MTLLSITDARAHKISFIEEKAHAELARIRKARDKQMYPYFREFETGGLHTTIAGHPIVNFSSNDYLGLTNHPKVKEAAHRAVDKYACGLSSSRVQATTVDHVSLENRLAKWFGFEKALVFTTGYQAMVGTISALADKDTTLILDSYSHACILDGTFLAAGTPGRAPEVRFFNHNSVKSLERILKTRERKNAIVLIEGVYSLDGDKAPIKEMVDICAAHDAFIILDEAQNTARSFLFSASLPVPIVAAASTILDMLEDEGPKMVTELHQKSEYFRSSLKTAGFDLGASNTHIMPVYCRDERKTLFMHLALLECGVLMVPILYPGVKIGEERLRVNVTRGHTQEDMDTTIELLKNYGDAFFVLSGEPLGELEDD